MEAMVTSIHELMLAVGVVVLLDLCRMAIKVIWHDIKKLDEAEEQEKTDTASEER